MIETTKNWFVGLSRREQILVTIAGLLAAGLIGYYGIARPLSGALDNAEDRYGVAVERQARIATKVAALQQPLGGERGTFRGALEGFVSQSAGETGLAVGSVTPQSDRRVTMVVDSAKPTALLGWLARIEREGIAVESLNINPARNETVSATLALRLY